MEGKIRDPFFCRSNFVRAQVLEGNGVKFAATFRDPAGVERTLNFSSRPGSKGELRGAKLQDKLANSSYETLADLISQRFGSEQDTDVVYAATPARSRLIHVREQLAHDGDARKQLGFTDKAAIGDYFQEMKNLIAPMAVEKTNLGAVWSLETTLHGRLSQEVEDNGNTGVMSPPVSLALPQPTDMAMLLPGKA